MFCLCVLIGDKMMYIIPNERLSSGRLVLAYVTISGVIITRSCLATRAVMIRVGFFPAVKKKKEREKIIITTV